MRPRGLAAAALAAASLIGARSAAQDPLAYLQLRINEVIANNNTVKPTNCVCRHVDMVEIYNPTGDQIRLYDKPFGAPPRAMKLTDGIRVWEFQDGHQINPTGHFLVFCDETECNQEPDCTQHIGSTGEAHAPFALDRDGETITLLGYEDEVVDQVAYPPLSADVSFGRYPDGADSFVFSPRVSEANDATSFGVCNRPPASGFPVCGGARNTPGANVAPGINLIDYSTSAPRSGEPLALLAQVKDEKLPDAQDIAGVAIVYRVNGGPEQESPMAFVRLETDEENLLDRWSIWEGQLSGQTVGSVVDFYLRVRDREGATGTAPESLCPWPTGPTPTCEVPYRYLVEAPYAGPLVLNEVVAENQSVVRDEKETFPAVCEDGTTDCRYDDFIEIYNSSTAEVDLSGLVLSSRPFHAAQGWVFPTGSRINTGQHLLVWVDGDADLTPRGNPPVAPPDPNDPATQEFHTDFAIDGRSDEVILFQPITRTDQTVVHRALNGLRWGRRGEPIDERETLISLGTEWTYLKGTAEPPQQPDTGIGPPLVWTHPRYQEGDWLRGPTGLGYGAGGISTVLPDMRGEYLTVYFRKKFEVRDSYWEEVDPPGNPPPFNQLKTLKRLFLEITYDDGFRAFLNDVPAAARNLARTGHDVPASAEIAPLREVFDITGVKDALRKGVNANVLAIEVHNASLDSADFVFNARLFWGVEGLGDDESLSRIPDGRLTSQPIKVPPESATPRAANTSPYRLFQRGDAAPPPDGRTNITDSIAILGHLFLGSVQLECLDAADMDDSGVLNIVDPIYLLSFLFQGGDDPLAPGPLACGPDPQSDNLRECVNDRCN